MKLKTQNLLREANDWTAVADQLTSGRNDAQFLGAQNATAVLLYHRAATSLVQAAAYETSCTHRVTKLSQVRDLWVHGGLPEREPTFWEMIKGIEQLVWKTEGWGENLKTPVASRVSLAEAAQAKNIVRELSLYVHGGLQPATPLHPRLQEAEDQRRKAFAAVEWDIPDTTGSARGHINSARLALLAICEEVDVPRMSNPEMLALCALYAQAHATGRLERPVVGFDEAIRDLDKLDVELSGRHGRISEDALWKPANAAKTVIEEARALILELREPSPETPSLA